MSDSDIELLRQYVHDRSEEAFSALTGRYAGLVYSSALRQTRDAHLAEDVTQSVFISLAQRARTIRSGELLSHWLLTATRYESCRAIRGQQRRRHHEQEAGQMGGTMSDAESPARWDEVAPALDEAISKLGRNNRDALLLRYFESQSTTQVAERLGISEAAARQRLSRAVDELRRFFARRGVAVTSVGLAALLSAKAVEAAPPHLAAMAASGAAGAGATGVTGGVLLKGAFLMAQVKTQATAIAAIVALLIAIVTVVAWQHTHRTARPNVVVVEPAAAAQPVTFFPPVRKQMVKGPSGVVFTAAGEPAGGVEVMLASPGVPVVVFNQAGAAATVTRSDANGRFAFGEVPAWTDLVVRGPQGIAHVQPADLDPGGRIVLEEWGRIEGLARAGERPLINEQIVMTRAFPTPLPATNPAAARAVTRRSSNIVWNQVVRTDGSGRFVFARVAPGTIVLGRAGVPEPLADGGRLGRNYYIASVQVSPGQTNHAEIGGSGRPVVGRLELLPPGQKLPLHGYVELRQPGADLDSVDYRMPVDIGPDGSFRAEDIPAGRHQLQFTCESVVSGGGMLELLATGSLSFEVPEMDGGKSREALNVGVVTVRARASVQIAAAAPPLEGKRADGGVVRLSDYLGKYVLLRFLQPYELAGTAAAWQFPGRDSQVMQDRLGQYDRMATLNVMLEHGHGISPVTLPAGLSNVIVMPDWEHKLDPGYANFPQTYLIDPGGKVLAKFSPYGDFGYGALDTALGSMRWQADGIDVNVETISPGSAAYSFKGIPPLAKTDAAQSAKFTLVDGRLRDDAGGLGVLNDGRGAVSADDPAASCYFEWGTLTGRVQADLGRAIPIARINTYSWHKSTRGPQVYRVYGSDGAAAGFDPAPKTGTDPGRCGWTPIAAVDTRAPDGPPGGQTGVSISATGGTIGEYRYLLFVFFVTETHDSWGHTFYNEIDAIER